MKGISRRNYERLKSKREPCVMHFPSFYIIFFCQTPHATSDCLQLTETLYARHHHQFDQKSRRKVGRRKKLSHHLLFNELSHSGAHFWVFTYNQLSNNSMMMLQRCAKIPPDPKNISCDTRDDIRH